MSNILNNVGFVAFLTLGDLHTRVTEDHLTGSNSILLLFYMHD